MKSARAPLGALNVINSASVKGDYPLNQAAWLWHPDVPANTEAFLVFKNNFSVTTGEEELTIQVSGDQRFELFCDGEFIASGPDKGHTFAWNFSAHNLTLTPGEHILTAQVWWLGKFAPESLCTLHGGFALKGEGAYDQKLTTGKASWLVAQRLGAELSPANYQGAYHVVGGRQKIDGAQFLREPREWCEPVITEDTWWDSTYGGVCSERTLAPSQLPEQYRQEICTGKFVAAVDGAVSDDYIYSLADCAAPALAEWNALITKAKAITVEPRTNMTLILDLENYYCAFSQISVSGGAGASIEWEWAEGLFLPNSTDKGNRDIVAGKNFVGFGHTFICNGDERQDYRPYWWNAGRFCRIIIKTAEEALVIRKLSLLETRYPLENELNFSADIPGITEITPLCIRTLQMCAHDAYMDCPYYEQLMYIGDTRLEALTTYAISADPRLPARAVRLFQESIRDFGIPASRTPSRSRQLISTFSMIWVWMVNDYYFWRGNERWLAEVLPDVRSVVDKFSLYINKDGLLEGLPGWLFVDWVDEWHCGYPPAAFEGEASSIVNLHYLLSLQKAAELEEASGEIEIGLSLRRKATALSQKIREYFYSEEKGLLADDLSFVNFSEHAQCLALLAGVFAAEPETERRVIAALLNTGGLARCSIYFNFYYLEVCARYGLTTKLLECLKFWNGLVENGLKTTIEKPEPSRSDCHAWGAYPLFFIVRGLLGLEPVTAGMKSIRLIPQLAGVKFLRGSVPHPDGEVTFDLHQENGTIRGCICVPTGVTTEIIGAPDIMVTAK